MIITHNRERLINSIIYFSQNTKYCGKTKLMKLLYFLDFIHFRETGKSVTGLDYYAWKMGPVPKDLYEEIDFMKPDMAKAISITPSGSFSGIRALKKFDKKPFTPRQGRILKELAEIFLEAKAAQMVEVTHLKKHPWDRTLKEKGEFQKIDYLLAVDGSTGSLDIDDVVEFMEERAEMLNVFGTAMG